MIGKCFECLALASLSSLAVRDVQKRELVVLVVCDRGGNARIHAARDETDRQRGALISRKVGFRPILFLLFFNLRNNLFGAAHHTPCTFGPQMYLCSCNCIRTSSPLAAIQFANCCRSIPSQTGEIRIACARVSSWCS